MGIEKLTKKAIRLLANTGEGELFLNRKTKFFLLKHSKPSELFPTLYEPALCLILQGAKEVVTGERVLEFGKGESLIQPIELLPE